MSADDEATQSPEPLPAPPPLEPPAPPSESIPGEGGVPPLPDSELPVAAATPAEAPAPSVSGPPAGPGQAPAQPVAAPQDGVFVLQPLTPLKDVSLPARPAPVEDERVFLATWSNAMERALREERPADAVRLSHVILRQLPRHLATYYRLIRAAWMLRRWEEGDAWGRRLLRADPGNALAWRAVAMAAEQRGERARAHARWQRAFECDPYEPEIRAGLVRTSVDVARLPVLNDACMASLLVRGYRWEQAASLYRTLLRQDGRRLDFQSGLLLALWQGKARDEAYELARALSQAQPFLLAAWVVIDDAGDVNDKALARHPISTMDPDGDYIRSSLALMVSARPVRLSVSAEDKALLTAALPAGTPSGAPVVAGSTPA